MMLPACDNVEMNNGHKSCEDEAKNQKNSDFSWRKSNGGQIDSSFTFVSSDKHS